MNEKESDHPRAQRSEPASSEEVELVRQEQAPVRRQVRAASPVEPTDGDQIVESRLPPISSNLGGADQRAAIKNQLQLTAPATDGSGPKQPRLRFSGTDVRQTFADKFKDMLGGAGAGAQTSPAFKDQPEQLGREENKDEEPGPRKTMPNLKLQEQLRNLIKTYGKKSNNDQESEYATAKPGKSKNMVLFESAFKKRLARTRIGNKSANEIILAAMEADYRAKKEYQKKRRASAVAGETAPAPFLRRSQTILPPQLADQISVARVNTKSDYSTTPQKRGTLDAEGVRERSAAALKRRKQCASFIDHTCVVVYMTLLTIYALYMDDIRMIALPPDYDDVFFGITLVAMICFALEILIASYAKDDYMYSFFFWLDIISTISMVPDCGWIWDPIIGEGASATNRSADASDLAKNSRASRAIRVIRIIRLIRLIRIVKLYKQQQIAKSKAAEFGRQVAKSTGQKKAPRLSQVENVDKSDSFNVELSSDEDDFDAQILDSDSDCEGEYDVPEESKISKTLSERILRAVVILVLLLLFLLPVVSSDTYISPIFLHEQGLKQLVAMYDSVGGDSDAYKQSLDCYVDRAYTHQEDKFPLVYLQAVGINDEGIKEYPPGLKVLRKDEYQSASETAKDGTEFIASYSMKSYTVVESIINICRTTFVVLILSLSSIFFTRDAQNLVLDPLERMIEKVKLIAKNPLVAASDEVNEAGIMSFFDQQKKGEDGNDEEEQYETAVLERAIVKIGHLLALGFGEAGSKIIAQNMKQTGELNAIMPGERTYAIFGFCILDDFVETTEVLQTDIMSYVNQVAEITHSIVDKYGGAPNKNIGEAFVLVWKFHNPDEIEAMDEDGQFNNYNICLQNQVVADMSVFSFIKIIAKLNKYNHILKYSKDDKMKVISDDFKVRMGFGLHQGWAIEGAIGSFLKVDASYLSPNVNMAARLEAATKLFKTPILISGPLRDLMSNQFQKVLREIDTVTVKGSIKPIRIFTITLETDDLEPIDDPMEFLSIREKKAVRDEMRRTLFKKLNSGEMSTWQEISRDKEFMELRKNVDIKFEHCFSQAYKQYIAGDWAKAGQEFEKLHRIRPKDGPTAALCEIINDDHQGVAPGDWKGYRPLTRKC